MQTSRSECGRLETKVESNSRRCYSANRRCGNSRVAEVAEKLTKELREQALASTAAGQPL